MNRATENYFDENFSHCARWRFPPEEPSISPNKNAFVYYEGGISSFLGEIFFICVQRVPNKLFRLVCISGILLRKDGLKYALQVTKARALHLFVRSEPRSIPAGKTGRFFHVRGPFGLTKRKIVFFLWCDSHTAQNKLSPKYSSAFTVRWWKISAENMRGKRRKNVADWFDDFVMIDG